VAAVLRVMGALGAACGWPALLAQLASTPLTAAPEQAPGAGLVAVEQLGRVALEQLGSSSDISGLGELLQGDCCRGCCMHVCVLTRVVHPTGCGLDS
jgi:hypothetical protein